MWTTVCTDTSTVQATCLIWSSGCDSPNSFKACIYDRGWKNSTMQTTLLQTQEAGGTFRTHTDLFLQTFVFSPAHPQYSSKQTLLGCLHKVCAAFPPSSPVGIVSISSLSPAVPPQLWSPLKVLIQGGGSAQSPPAGSPSLWQLNKNQCKLLIGSLIIDAVFTTI